MLSELDRIEMREVSNGSLINNRAAIEIGCLISELKDLDRVEKLLVGK